MATAAAIDHIKLEAFMGKMIGDMSAAMSGALVIVGAKSGLYKALARGPATSAELAERSGLFERYVREWLAAQAASGFVDYDADSGRYSMGPEQTAALADSNSPVYVADAFEVISSAYIDEPKITAAFKSGRGVGWHEHHECLFRGTERFFRTGYRANLLSSWLPALAGAQSRGRMGQADASRRRFRCGRCGRGTRLDGSSAVIWSRCLETAIGYWRSRTVTATPGP